jgi:site-specific DNA recombinase
MTPPSSLRAAVYARVSSEHQVERDTIASQLDLLRRRVQADGLTLEPEACFTDDGYSGETLLRPALERLRDHVAAGGLDRLYVECPDRLARNYAHQMVVVEELGRAGVEVVFLNHPTDASPEGRLLLQVQSVIAEYERAKIRERTRRGRLHAARSGQVSVLSHAPYGYRYLRKSEQGPAAYLIEMAEAPTVQAMFQWVAVEGCSLRQVCRRLQDRGVLTRTGKTHWDRATVLGMLTNPAYAGTAQFGKVRIVPARPRLRPRRGVAAFPRRPSAKQPTRPEDRIPIAVPALVSPEVFAAVQDRLAENRRHPGRVADRAEALLQGLVVCRQCGYAYVRKQAGGRAGPEMDQRYLYYRCCGTMRDRHHGRRLCEAAMVRADRLEAAVWSDVRGLLLEPGRLEAEYQRRLAGEGPAAPRPGTTLGKLIRQVKQRLSRLIEMYADGHIDKPEFQNQMEVSKQRLSELEAEAEAVADEERQRQELRLVLGAWESFRGEVQEGLDHCDGATQRRIIRALIKAIEVDATGVRIVYRVSPSPFVESPTGGNVPLCWGRSAAPPGLKKVTG